MSLRQERGHKGFRVSGSGWSWAPGNRVRGGTAFGGLGRERGNREGGSRKVKNGGLAGLLPALSDEHRGDS